MSSASDSRVASLAMYAGLPPLEAANDALWAAVRDRLRADGLTGVPGGLDRTLRHDAAWHDPRLLLAQTCGFPLVKSLAGVVRLVATPVYRFPGGDGPHRRSVVVVATASPARTVEDLRGRRVAVNDPESNSGMNLLRALVAPLAREGRFFSDVVMTGGHHASLAAVASGRADVAAIDSVTFGLAARHAPALVAGVRVLAETPGGPGLPFVTRAAAGDGEVEAIRRALAAAMADAALAGARETLGLAGLEVLSDADYAALAEHERRAAALGYPVVA